VNPLTNIDDCFNRRLLQKVRPSGEKAYESLDLARSYLDEARKAASASAQRMSFSAAYLAWFHSARALLFRDGIREKSHYCIELYLETYVQAGKLEEDWILMFNRLRNRRHENQYSFGTVPTDDEIKTAIDEAERFIERIRLVLLD